MNTPVLFIIFNRPGPTQEVFNQIAKVRPKQLFIAADGARNNEEENLCQATRSITEKIDWDCTVQRLYRTENLGCKIGVSSAIDWFFQNIEEGIILEDDCLPSESFFTYCQDILDRYRDNKQIMHIAGTNLHLGHKYGDKDYFFSRLTPVWGWATWKRAWDHYDLNLNDLQKITNQMTPGNFYPHLQQEKKFINTLNEIQNGKIDTWDYQWEFTVRKSNGLSIYPNINLIENIGFGIEGAVHTNYQDQRIMQNKAKSLEIPLQHPTSIIPNDEADKAFFNEFVNNSFFMRVKRKIKKILAQTKI